MALRLLRRRSTPSTRRHARPALVAAVLAIAAVGTVGVAPAAAADSLKLAVTHDLPGRCRQGRRPRDDGRDLDQPEAEHGDALLLLRHAVLRRAARGEVGPGDVGRSAPDGDDQGARPVPRRRRPHAQAALPPDPDDAHHVRPAGRQAALGQPRSASAGRTPRSRSGPGATRGSPTSGSSCRPKFSGDVRALPADTRDQLTSTSKDGRLTYAADDIADPESLVRDRRHRRPRRADRRLARPRRRGRRHPRLARGSRVARPRVDASSRPACPTSRRPSGCRGRSTASSGSARCRRRRSRATPGCTTRRPTRSRSARTSTSRSSSTRRRTPGSTAGCSPQRWISEGLADEYASRVIAAEGRTVAGPDTGLRPRQGGLPPQRLAAAVPRRRDDDGVRDRTATTRRGPSSGRSSTTSARRRCTTSSRRPRRRPSRTSDRGRPRRRRRPSPTGAASSTSSRMSAGRPRRPGCIETWVVTGVQRAAARGAGDRPPALRRPGRGGCGLVAGHRRPRADERLAVRRPRRRR